MIIDSHQHLMLPYELQLEKLDEAGVDKAILFCTAPHPEKAKNYQELKKEMDALYSILAGVSTKEEGKKRLKQNIQDMVSVLKQYPDRFWGFGSIPLGLSLQETIQWIDEYIISNGLKGVGEFTPGSEEQVRQLEVIFEALEQFPSLPIWVHTFHPVSINGLRILMELTHKHPRVSVIYGHMGGSNWMELLEFARKTKNAFIDLSAAFSTLAVRMAVSELPERCLFSSDAPYGEPYLSRQLIEYVSPSDTVTQRVLGDNIQKLVGER